MSELPQPFGGYVLLKLLGSGVSGEVFLAKPREHNGKVPSPVVIKRLHAELADNAAFALRFKQEAQIAIAVDDVHVARVYEVGSVGPAFYMAIEYVPGWTIARVVNDLRETASFASLSSIRDIVGDALEGLHALHIATDPSTRQPLSVVHRDIAPKNLILGEDSVTRLIDLGIGKSAYQDWKTNTGVVIGSPGYMSPEQARGGEIDQTTDLYSMGLILWELLTSKSFIERAPVPVMLRLQAEPNYRAPSTIRADVPPAVDEVVARAMAKDPRARFQSAKEMQDALYAAIGPRQEEVRASSTIVGALLWGELGESKTEITDLLSVSGADVESVTSDDTLKIAEREVAPPPPPPPAAEPIFISVPKKQRAGLSWTVVIGLMLIALAAGILISAQLLVRAPPPPAPPPRETIAQPAVEARAIEQTVHPSESAPSVKKRVPEHAAAVRAPAQIDPRAKLQDLIDRTRKLHQHTPARSEKGKAATRLMTEINLEAARAEPDPAALERLEEKLRKLETN